VDVRPALYEQFRDIVVSSAECKKQGGLAVGVLDVGRGSLIQQLLHLRRIATIGSLGNRGKVKLETVQRDKKEEEKKNPG
jgi:hypothetical protein